MLRDWWCLNRFPLGISWAGGGAGAGLVACGGAAGGMILGGSIVGITCGLSPASSRCFLFLL